MTKPDDRQDPPALILGGGGFIGTNLTERLCSAGQPVINFSRSWLTRRAGVEYVKPDPDSSGQLDRLIARAGIVYHMAHGFSPRTALERMDLDLLSSMELNFQVMQACEIHGVPLLYLSSGGTVYGATAVVPTPEEAETHPIGPYGLSKLTAERYLELRHKFNGLDHRILRISNPYGPWQFGRNSQGVIGTWLHRIRSGEAIEIWGDGEVVRDYIYVEDVAEALVRVAEYEGPKRIFNIGSGEGISLNRLLAELHHLFDGGVRCQYRPAGPADVPVSILDITRAERELGWHPRIGIGEGLRRTLDWVASDHRET